MRGEINRSAVILDRHPLWLDALDRLLANVGFVVVGRATEGDEALALIEAHRPDVFIAGINAASAEQVAVVRKAQQSQTDLKCVVVADSAELEAIEAAFAAGASVYCIRTAEEGDFASAIRQAFARSIYIAANAARDAGPVDDGRAGSGCASAHPAGAGDSPARRRGPLELAAGAVALGHRADGEVPPVEHLPQAQRRQPHRGEPLGSAERAPVEPARTGERRGGFGRVAVVRCLKN